LKTLKLGFQITRTLCLFTFKKKRKNTQLYEFVKTVLKAEFNIHT
jgi:hypothetical protein